VSISKDATPPAFEWINRYVAPADMLRLLPITYISRTGYTPLNYQLESGYILTNLGSPANLVYIRRVEITGDFDPQFTLTLASRLALGMAHWMTGKVGYVAQMKELYAEYLRDALELNQLEAGNQVPFDDEFLLSRE
jgi:hypothetical protein